MKTNCVSDLANRPNYASVSDDLDPYQELLAQTQIARIALVTHPIYRQVNNLTAIQVFMRSHVFAVWDFMTLLKTLQHRLTGLNLPWLPDADITAARLINEIVLAEETDEVTPGNYLSHFHLYIEAMEEVGADTQPIHEFIETLELGFCANYALSPLTIPATTKSFVQHTLAAAGGSTHEVAAVFLLGREEIIPTMFSQIVTQLETTEKFSCTAFRLYLERHTELDAEKHAPMGQKLLRRLCGNDKQLWQQACFAANAALEFRKSLWDGISEVILNTQ